MAEPAMKPADYADIQGLVRFAHGHLVDSAFLLLRIKDVAAAKLWLSEAPVTNACATEQLPDHAMQIALSSEGLRELRLPEELLLQFSEEFLQGMAGDENRARRLGDQGRNAASSWKWGGNVGSLPHLLVMLYARQGELNAIIETTVNEPFAGAFDIILTQKSLNNGPREPFGFIDGVSQPAIDWEQTLSTDLHRRASYAHRAALGEFLLGYRNEYGLFTQRPLVQSQPGMELPDAEEMPGYKDLGRNGTYLVYRQLSQNVPAFWQYLDQQADGDEDRRKRLAEAMVGRQVDGEALLPGAPHAIDGIDPASGNHFTYDSDPHGHLCPLGAHVRRSNPRTGDYPPGVNGLISMLIRTLGFGRRHAGDDLVASTRFHRILRRGRVYGGSLTLEKALQQKTTQRDVRGLHFICLGANISRQFEFVQNAWNMSGKFAGLADEPDPLLGNRETLLDGQSTDHFRLPRQGMPAQCLKNIPQFVRVRGGGYFFLPGLRALRYIARS